jgi:hypothetical protein
MEPKRLYEIHILLQNEPPGKRLDMCRGLNKELGVTLKDIEKEKVAGYSEIVRLRRKTMRATYTKLRSHIINFGIEKGILALGKPLPRIGAWDDAKVFLRISEKFLLTVPQNSDLENKRVTHRDPLNNPEFINLLNEY